MMTESSSHAVSKADLTPATTPAAETHDGHDADHPFLQHHYDTPEQQFDAGKLGIWLFLVTEVLFFAGLFVAYTIYRAQHPSIFFYSHYFLDTNLGAVNTVVLLLSSMTAAWAVRSAQLGRSKTLALNVAITIVCALGFLGIKYVEYSHKIHDGLLWGRNFQPQQELWQVESFQRKHPEAAELAAALARLSPAEAAPATDAPKGDAAAADLGDRARALVASAPREAVAPLVQAGLLRADRAEPRLERPNNVHVFFGIYFFMTGLHGVHVLAGIIVWAWILRRALAGHFGPRYFGPVDYAALYWHLVDLVWIYLFPLLYLIH
jgi:cytochrome c oxidase subunit 3